MSHSKFITMEDYPKGLIAFDLGQIGEDATVLTPFIHNQLTTLNGKSSPVDAEKIKAFKIAAREEEKTPERPKANAGVRAKTSQSRYAQV